MTVNHQRERIIESIIMKIHEYQAREIFRKYSLPVPGHVLCHSVDDVRKAVENMDQLVVIKAQVLTGGRGKAGGVKLARTPEEAVKAAEQIFGMEVKGYKVEKVIVADAVDIEHEYYVGLVNDRNTKSATLMVSAEGGVEIEEVAKNAPDQIYKLSINPLTGLPDFQSRNLAMKLFKDVKLARKAATVFQKLYRVYVDTDATLAEINPLVLTPSGELLAIDGKMNFDDNALFRQPEILALREADEDEQKEIEAREKGLSYIRLNGNIGCMVNGAGLAMATMDMIKLYGGSPANFLDIGGSSNPRKVVDAMNILLSDKNVQVVMINIFGGITRGDDVARGLKEALKTIKTDIPIVVRLSGTNAEEGIALLKETGLTTVSTMSEAAQKAIGMSRR